MKHIHSLIFGVVFLITYGISSAQEVSITVDDLKVTVTGSAGQCVGASGRRGWNSKSYEFKYKESGSLFWEEPVYLDYPSFDYSSSLFSDGIKYEFKVKYYGTKPYCGGGMYRVRTLDTKSFVYNSPIHFDDAPVSYPEVEIIDDSRRIKNIEYGKCFYPHTWNGGSIGLVRLRNWSCWGSDAQAFIIEDFGIHGSSGNELVRLKSQLMNLCVKPKNHYDLAEIGMSSCLSFDAIYELDMVSSATFRLKNTSNQKCLFANPSNGGLIQQQTCSNSPDMIFELEEY